MKQLPRGINFDAPFEDYLTLPALSAGVILTAYRKCRAAAHYEYVEGIKQTNDDATELTDIGTVAHALVLGGPSTIQVIDPNDHPSKTTGAIPDGWTNNSIRAARAAAREAGKIPILKPKYAEIEACALAVNTFISSLEMATDAAARAVYAAFRKGGYSEVSIVWDEGKHLAKCRPDRFDGALVVDLKFTSASAEPRAWGRQALVRDGHYTRAAWYLRGLAARGIRDAQYIFLVCEITPPYLCSLVGMDAHARELGARQVEEGLAVWNSNAWDGYPREVIYPEIPAWEDEQYAVSQEARGIAYDVAKLFPKENR